MHYQSSVAFFFSFLLKEALPRVVCNERRRKRQLREAKYISSAKDLWITWKEAFCHLILTINLILIRKKKASQLKKMEKHHHIPTTVRGKMLISAKQGHCYDRNIRTKRENMVLHNASQQLFFLICSAACSTFRLLHGGAEKDKSRNRKAVFKKYTRQKVPCTLLIRDTKQLFYKTARFLIM